MSWSKPKESNKTESIQHRESSLRGGTNREHTNDNATHEHLMHHEQNNGVHFREAFRVSLMKHANQIREKHEDATGVSLTVNFMKCSMARQELTTVV